MGVRNAYGVPGYPDIPRISGYPTFFYCDNPIVSPTRIIQFLLVSFVTIGFGVLGYYFKATYQRNLWSDDQLRQSNDYKRESEQRWQYSDELIAALPAHIPEPLVNNHNFQVFLKEFKKAIRQRNYPRIHGLGGPTHGYHPAFEYLPMVESRMILGIKLEDCLTIHPQGRQSVKKNLKPTDEAEIQCFVLSGNKKDCFYTYFQHLTESSIGWIYDYHFACESTPEGIEVLAD